MGKFPTGLVLGAALLAVLGYSRAYSDGLSGTGHINLMNVGGEAVSIGPGGQYGGSLRVVPAFNNAVLSGTYQTTASDNSFLIQANGGGGFTFLYQLVIQNTTNDEMDVRIFNASAAPDCTGSDILKMNIVAPPNQTLVIPFPTAAFFDLGIGFCITGVNADDDDTNATTGLNLTYVYQ